VKYVQSIRHYFIIKFYRKTKSWGPIF
jgi:hypothetical protein